jgi:two-component system, NarL family, sensor histidine kinase UhpB
MSDQAVCLFCFATIEEGKKEFNKAENFYLIAKSIVDTNLTIDLQLKLKIYKGLSELYQKKGEWEKALTALNTTIIYSDSLLNRDEIMRIASYETSLTYEKDKIKQAEILNKIEQEKLKLQNEKLQSEFLFTKQKSELLSKKLEAETQSKNIALLESENKEKKITLDLNQSKIKQSKAENEAQSVLISLNTVTLNNRNLQLVLVLLLSLLGMAMLYYYFKKIRKKDVLTLRTGLAQDLHDDLGSEMSSLSHKAYAAVHSSDTEKMQSVLQSVAITSSSLVDDMRDIVWSMNPDNTTMSQLIMKMKDLESRHNDNNDFLFHYDIENQVEQMKLEPIALKNIFLFYKETLNNISKHAYARDIYVKMSIVKKQFQFQIEDNGIGFDYHKSTISGTGSGLPNLKRRATLLKGQLNIHSVIEKGTSVILSIPMG